MSNETEEALWNFASGIYQQEAVKETCLKLQDSADANVNVILWLTWLATYDIKLERGALAEALRVVGDGHTDLLKSLRQARSHLRKTSSFTRVQSQMIRKHILAAELAAEKVMLQKLQDLTARLPIAGAESEHLTLLDYLLALGVKDPGQTATILLQQSRFHRACAEDDICTLH